MRIGRRAVITGRVQGVSFRAWTQMTANRLNLSGWVRNRSDGAVEAHIEGEEHLVAALLLEMRTGPQHARVAGVSVQEADVADYDSFFVSS